MLHGPAFSDNWWKAAVLLVLLQQLVTDLKRRQLPVTVSTLAFNLGSLSEVREKLSPSITGIGL